MFSRLFAFVVAVLALLVNILAIPLARSQGYMRGLQHAIDVVRRAKDSEADHESS